MFQNIICNLYKYNQGHLIHPLGNTLGYKYTNNLIVPLKYKLSNTIKYNTKYKYNINILLYRIYKYNTLNINISNGITVQYNILDINSKYTKYNNKYYCYLYKYINTNGNNSNNIVYNRYNYIIGYNNSSINCKYKYNINSNNSISIEYNNGTNILYKYSKESTNSIISIYNRYSNRYTYMYNIVYRYKIGEYKYNSNNISMYIDSNNTVYNRYIEIRNSIKCINDKIGVFTGIEYTYDYYSLCNRISNRVFKGRIDSNNGNNSRIDSNNDKPTGWNGVFGLVYNNGSYFNNISLEWNIRSILGAKSVLGAIKSFSINFTKEIEG
ncbi:hypothetical protein NEOKW01_0146 [Nematocida sp. AWRm80]|nr:hypothetical protein NEOKW01_0146 [Nematocida sp. AWRm80]